MKRGPLGLFVLGLITFGVILSQRSNVVLSTPSDRPLQTLSSPSPSSTGPVGRPERKPHIPNSSSLNIYVINNKISPRWGLNAAIEAWEPAKWTDFVLISECPVAAPCVIISEKSLKGLTAGETLFTNTELIYVHLDPKVKLATEAHNTLAHELGHVLGAGHVIGTTNSVMPAKGIFKTRPSRFDLQMVDSLGQWDAEKMYTSSGKTVDGSVLPK